MTMGSLVSRGAPDFEADSTGQPLVGFVPRAR
jgi:hypothetical protein